MNNSLVNTHNATEDHSGRDSKNNENALIILFVTILSYALIVITLPFSIFACMRMVQVRIHLLQRNVDRYVCTFNGVCGRRQEYERAVIFRLGRIKRGGAVGPGLFFVVPCLDQMAVVDLRTISFDVPPQEVLTRDSVTIAVDAVVYYRIRQPIAAVCNIAEYNKSTKLLASTTLRNVLGTKSLSDILSDREIIAHAILDQLDAATDPWGIKV